MDDIQEETDYSKFACPNPACELHGQFNQGNIRYRSRVGRQRHILRLKCCKCGREFSEHKWSLMEGGHLDVKTVECILKCIRWGVMREGIADICGVNVKTVDRYLDKTAEHGEKLHDARVKDLVDTGLQCDEAHSKIRRTGASWLWVAITTASLFIVGFVVGPRNQDMANSLLAKVLSRFKKIPMLITDGCPMYVVSFCLMFGELFKACGKRAHRLRCRWLQYVQVVKERDSRGALIGVKLRCIFGNPIACCQHFIRNGIGKVIHTSHIERWFGSLRTIAKNFQRRTRCMPWFVRTQTRSLWLYTTCYNWFIPHKTLSKKHGLPCTPAMAAGLIDHVMTYTEFIWLRLPPIKDNPLEKALLEKANDQERIAAYKRSSHCKGKPIDKDKMRAMTC